MSHQPNYSYIFGPYRLDVGERQLWCDGRTITLQPKDIDILLALVEQPGHLLTKDELMEIVWPDSIVEESNIPNHISHLRKALSEESDEQYIKTVSKRGYQFVAKVQRIETRNEVFSAPDFLTPSAQQADNQIIAKPELRETIHSPPAGWRRKFSLSNRWLLAVFLVLVFFLGGATAYYYFNHRPVLTNKDSILLADFENQTGDAVFDETLRQAVAVHLGQSPFLNIFPDERVRETLRLMNRSPDEHVTVSIGREICQRQGLKALLAGSIAALGNN